MKPEAQKKAIKASKPEWERKEDEDGNKVNTKI